MPKSLKLKYEFLLIKAQSFNSNYQIFFNSFIKFIVSLNLYDQKYSLAYSHFFAFDRFYFSNFI
jgi:hypothetical protein